MHPLKRFLRLAPVLLLVAGAPRALAQQPAAQTLEQNTYLPQPTQSAPPSEFFNKELGQISPVQTYPKPPTLTASVSQQAFYTDNVFYTDSNPVGSAGYLGNYTVAYVPYSTRDWTPQVALQYNMVRYARAAEGDFDNENLALSSNYVFSDDRAWSWTASVDLSRFTSPHNHWDMFYDEVVYDNQINYTRGIIENTLYFVGSYELTYHQSHPDYYDRVDNALSASLIYYALPELSISAFVRPAWWAFPSDSSFQHDRNDFNLSDGLEVMWRPWKYFSLSADIVETDDFSSAAGQSFSVTTPGFALTGTLAF